jgi:hypothetical protein
MRVAPGNPAPEEPGAGPKAASSDAAPGLPGLRTWRAVYWAVTASFILWVALLAVLTHLFA